MCSLQIAVAAYIAEHGSIDSTTYQALTDLYTTEISGETRRLAEDKRRDNLADREAEVKSQGGVTRLDDKRNELLAKQANTMALRLQGDIDEIIKLINDTFSAYPKFKAVVAELNTLKKNVLTRAKNLKKSSAEGNYTWWKGGQIAKDMNDIIELTNKYIDDAKNSDGDDFPAKKADMILKKMAFIKNLNQNKSPHSWEHSASYTDSYESKPKSSK